MKYNFIDLFAGIGGFHLALNSLGMKCVFSCEIDNHARKTYLANFKEKFLSSSDFFPEDIWNINVKNISQLKNALKKPIIINKIEYIKFEEKNGKSIILSVEDIIKEDVQFSKDYKYELNELHKKYMKKLNINSNSNK